jgi:hypothetical protein
VEDNREHAEANCRHLVIASVLLLLLGGTLAIVGSSAELRCGIGDTGGSGGIRRVGKEVRERDGMCGTHMPGAQLVAT